MLFRSHQKAADGREDDGQNDADGPGQLEDDGRKVDEVGSQHENVTVREVDEPCCNSI